jgi:hypothetical protein
MLALVAAFTVAFGVHPPHAAAAQADDHRGTSHQGMTSHSHFGASCLQAELDKPLSDSKGAVPPGHADCSQAFAPPFRPVAVAAPAYVVAAVATPHDRPFRQLITSFDPPPPRRG